MNSESVMEAQFAPNTKTEVEASRATLFSSGINLSRGRKRLVTSERIKTICDKLAQGDSEQAACLLAGIGLTAWNAAKRNDADLRQRIAAAKAAWGRLKYERYKAALYESQCMRPAGRRPLKPEPIRQAKFVVNYLAVRVPLHFAAIPEQEIINACQMCALPLDRWQRQEQAFGLMKKVIAKRAKIRGEQPQPMQIRSESPWDDWRPNDDDPMNLYSA